MSNMAAHHSLTIITSLMLLQLLLLCPTAKSDVSTIIETQEGHVQQEATHSQSHTNIPMEKCLEENTCESDYPSNETQNTNNGASQASFENDKDTKDEKEDVNEKPCGVYLAHSTLPGTGIGMFAGRDYESREPLLEVGDHIIPIVSLPQHQGHKVVFLWDEYTWNPSVLRCEHEGIGTMVASPGFGAAANSFLDFVNVDEGTAIQSIAGKLHRSKDPGAGAFTAYHSRTSVAQVPIHAGQELFVDYGNHWFFDREQLGPVPVEGNHEEAQGLYESYMELADEYNDPRIRELFEEAWKTVVLESGNPWQSRVLAALPTTMEDHTKMLDIGLVELRTQQMVRSLEWLEENGVCADNMRMKESTLPQAGHGVFANRRLKQNSVILPVPVIHFDKHLLDMYEFETKGYKSSHFKILKFEVTRKQLLLNYCLGHEDSSMILSPYGPVFNLINHNQTLANVKLQWADPKRSNHHPELLNKDVKSLNDEYSSKLAMELVALRDIHPDEEIFLDYGDAWEKAWWEHVAQWKPVEGAENYISAEMLNDEPDPLPTEFDKIKNPYPPNVGLMFDMIFEDDEWKKHNTDAATLTAFQRKQHNSDWVECEILASEKSDTEREDGTTPMLYTVVINDDGVDKVKKGVPRESLVHINRPFSSDMLLPNAFRHEIRIPDELFPEAWKNRKH